MSYNPAHFKKVPISEITSAQKPGPLWTFMDHWWRSDGKNVFIYIGPTGKANSPQCNSNHAIAERIFTCGDRVILLPWAWHQFSLSEYQD